jgi:uncharacterized membrane protein
MYASDYRARARSALSGNWLISALTVFIASLLGGTWISSSGSIRIDQDTIELFKSVNIPVEVQLILTRVLMVAIPALVISFLISFLIGGTIRLGYAKYLLDQHDCQPLQVGTLFSQFHQYRNGFCLALLTAIYTTLWSLLLIIPGIIASFSYAMAPFIQAEHPEYTASESLRASKEMMRGHKWELFCLSFSFIGWALLCVFTLGIGSIFLNAYQSAAYAAFYREICIEAPGVSSESNPSSNEWPFNNQVNE